MAYSFDFINGDGTIDHFALGMFGDDAEALRQARAALLASTTAVTVDVWKGDARIGRIEGPSWRSNRNAPHRALPQLA